MMTQLTDAVAGVAGLAQDLVRIDSRSSRPNIPVADRLEGALAAIPGLVVERTDYTDASGTAKRVLVAARGQGGLALSGHMDTVPDTGWTDDPWSGRIDADGRLHGLGSVDMKGPIAAIIGVAAALPVQTPVCLLITTDEETTKEGARAIVERSRLARAAAPRGIVVAEPTGMRAVRGHRSSILFTVTATGVQAHSSTGRGVNANWTLAPFLTAMHDLHNLVRNTPEWRNPAYDPPFGDFNLVIDNHGAPVNMTVPRATVQIKFRYAAGLDPAPIVAAVRTAADTAGMMLDVFAEGPPLELPPDHPLVAATLAVTGERAAATAPFGTDAAVLQSLAPCIVLGPGDIAVAHTPDEYVRVSDLTNAVPILADLAQRVAAS
jgi:acetylornithine deacetylase/succinyl-diaminopimelate desuccinylase-like protein